MKQSLEGFLALSSSRPFKAEVVETLTSEKSLEEVSVIAYQYFADGTYSRNRNIEQTVEVQDLTAEGEEGGTRIRVSETIRVLGLPVNQVEISAVFFKPATFTNGLSLPIVSEVRQFKYFFAIFKVQQSTSSDGLNTYKLSMTLWFELKRFSILDGFVIRGFQTAHKPSLQKLKALIEGKAVDPGDGK